MTSQAASPLHYQQHVMSLSLLEAVLVQKVIGPFLTKDADVSPYRWSALLWFDLIHGLSETEHPMDFGL